MGEGGGCRVDGLDDDVEYEAIVRNKLLGGCGVGDGCAEGDGYGCGEGGGCIVDGLDNNGEYEPIVLAIDVDSHDLLITGVQISI